MATRFYAPASIGMFTDMVDDFGRAGASCVAQSPSFIRCTWRGAHFTIIRDDDGIRAQLMDDGGLGAHAWDVVDPILSRRSAQYTGWASSGMSSASLSGPECVGAFFYDKDLAQFGNAFSPFVQTSSFEAANLALQRPFQDRYNPRYDNQPTWADWQSMSYASEGQDPSLPGGPCGCFPTRECLERNGLCVDCDSSEHVGVDPGPTCWTDPDTGVISMFPTLTAAKRAADESVKRHAVTGGFESIDRRALVVTGVIAGITTLLALNHKKHWLEISAAGIGGIAIAWGMSAGAKITTSR
jgi:hypothetical protein